MIAAPLPEDPGIPPIIINVPQIVGDVPPIVIEPRNPNPLEETDDQAEEQPEMDPTAADDGLNRPLAEIKMPSTFKSRGRPRGMGETVIGLTRKIKPGVSTLKKAKPFPKLREEEKSIKILSWFVGLNKAELALSKSRIIEEEDVEVLPQNIPWAILDEDVNLPLVQKYFSQDAWALVQQIEAAKRDNPFCECGECKKDLDGSLDHSMLETTMRDESISIRCDHCMEWYHLSCVKLKKRPKATYWMCNKCK